MERSLTQMSEDYFKAADDINSLIMKYRQQLKEAYKSKDYLKTYEIKRKLTVFYDQKRDILDTAYTLQNYYESEREVLPA
ncbi:MAG: hypothetical protein IJ447_01055 [Clostridia bacterium]|nr:hypothetical protein [Clostridia bacterium]